MGEANQLQQTTVHASALAKSWPTQEEVPEQRLPTGGVPHEAQMASHRLRSTPGKG